MRVAIPVNEDRKTVCISFGRTPEFLFWDTETDERIYLKNEAADAPGGAGISAAQFIVDQETNVLLTPRCGENAAKVFDVAGVKLYKTTSDDLEEELKKYKNGEMEILTEIHAGFHHPSFGE